MPYLISNIPHFKCWVRREYTCNHEQYHGEFLHGMAIAVNTIPDRCLSFQIIFTGCESDFDDNEQIDTISVFVFLRQTLKNYLLVPCQF